MKKHLMILLLVSVVVALLTFTASAADVSDLDYEIKANSVTINGCNRDASGDLVIPSTIDGYPVTRIEDYALSGCEKLTGITIPSSITEIGCCAFSRCTSLKGVFIPDSVLKIGGGAFYECSSLRSVQLPNSIKALDTEDIYTEGNETDYAGFFENCSSLKAILIPESVRTIGGEAFLNCTSLESITIPNGVTSIWSLAFQGCTGLTEVTLPDSVTDLGGGVFCGCTSLREVKLPRTITELPMYLYSWDEYEGDDDEYSPPPDIKYGFFENCKNLSKITIPDSVTSIGGRAFFNCISLPSITIPSGVTSIGHGTFSGCSNLTSISIPSGVTSIEDSTFSGCSSLTSVSIPNGVTSIGSFTFSGCSSLKNVTLPSKLTGIGYYAFEGCSNLTGITIPDSVLEVGDCAFLDCSSLSEVHMPKNITRVGRHVFDNTGFYNDAGNWKNDVLYCGKVLIRAKESVTQVSISGGTSVIAGGAFYDCSNLTRVTIPGSVKSIGSSAFKNCVSLANVTIPNGVSIIEISTFNNCKKMGTITIPKSVTRIQYDAFADCHLDDVFYTGTESQWENIVIEIEAYGTFGMGNEILDSDYQTIHYNYSPVSITSQPKSVSAVAGKTATMKVAASGTGLTYQWQYKAPNGRWTNSPADGNRTATLKVPATVSRNGYQYRCVVTDESGYTAASNASKLTVFGIKTQPTSITAKVGKTATMKVAATGKNLTYQWQYKAPNGKWTNSPATGNQTATLSVPATIGRNGYQYRCVVKSGNATINSKAATLTVFGIKTQPKSISTTAGKNVTMKVVATGKNLTYQWQYKTPSGDWKNSVGEGNQTNTLTIKATTGRHNYQFRCVVKSGSNKVYSKAATLTVFGIKTQPANVSAPIGKTVTMKVVATGTNLTYQWQYKTDAGTWKNTTLEGAKTAALKIPVTAARNGNVYRCVVKCGSASVNSNAAKVTVFAIKTQPTNVTAVVGKTVTMKVVATGENLTYQWQYKAADGTWKNTTLTGAKTATLSIPATKARNGNVYRCVVKCGAYTLNSSAAKLTVK